MSCAKSEIASLALLSQIKNILCLLQTTISEEMSPLKLFVLLSIRMTIISCHRSYQLLTLLNLSLI